MSCTRSCSSCSNKKQQAKIDYENRKLTVTIPLSEKAIWSDSLQGNSRQVDKCLIY